MSTQDMMQQCDGMLGYLMNKLEEQKLMDKTNILLTSDHGLIQMPNPNNLFVVTDHVNASDILKVASNGILPVPGKEELVYGILKQHQGNVTAFRRDDMPDRLRVKGSEGFLPLYLMPEPGWIVVEVRLYYVCNSIT
jgi:ectonucleotide pyrophosphatase/phosphodiesterase family protein 5